MRLSGVVKEQFVEVPCRYITRPALSGDHVKLAAAGKVELKLKMPWRDSTTHLVMSPLEFMQRLVALYDRTHQWLLHGCQSRESDARFGSVPAGYVFNRIVLEQSLGLSDDCTGGVWNWSAARLCEVACSADSVSRSGRDQVRVP